MEEPPRGDAIPRGEWVWNGAGGGWGSMGRLKRGRMESEVRAQVGLQ